MKIIIFISCIIFSFHQEIKAQSTASKQVSTFVIEAPELNTKKKIWLYLPKSYTNSTIDYPVIYMHDAQNLFDASTSFVGEWNIDEYIDSLSEKEVIVVGIEHGNEKRIEELTPYVHKDYGGGKGDSYLLFIINTLKPQIDSNYRTLKAKEHTTMIGSSLGGLISFYAILKYPDTFGSVGIFSPAFWVNPEIYDLASSTIYENSLRFYFLAGTDESETMVENMNRMIDVLISKGVKNSNIQKQIIEGGQHNEALWRTYYPDAHQWLIKN